MKGELEQFYKDIQVIEKYNPVLYAKLLAKFYVDVLPVIQAYEAKNSTQ